MTLAPDGAIAFDGAIVDGRDVWANLDQQASEDVARRSILAHAEARSGLPAAELDVAGLHQVAVPRVQRIGWVGTVRSGLGHVATIVVDGDPEASLPLPILHAEHIDAAGLVNEVAIGVLAEDPATDVFTPPEQTAGIGELLDGSPLRGSTRGADVILGTERVVGYDVTGAASYMGLQTIPPVASATAAFDAMPGTFAYDVQNHYVRVQSFYSFADRYMAGVWESLNTVSSFPPGEFAPRVMLWINPGFDLCGVASFCAGYIPFEGMDPQNLADEYRQLSSGLVLENLGIITIEAEGAAAHVLAHEFGHIVDLFAAPYTTDAGLGCTGAAGCAPSCQLDTTEEAPTLREALAQLFAIAATSALYPVATFDNCDPLHAISLGGDGAPHSDTCRPDGEPYSHFLELPCPPGTGICDHDFDVGMDMGQPTGLCNASDGYRIDSLHQAFWEIFQAESCAATPPYTCTPMSLPAGLSASDAFMPALLYALRIDAKSFRQLIDAFATHVSCNLGPDVYEEVNAVLCHHDLRTCGAPPPVICEWCNNGVREGLEACDGNDFGGESCEGHGFSGGMLACNGSCMIITTMCEAAETGLDETGATTTESEATGSGTSASESSTGGSAGSSGDTGGCGCRAGSGGRAPLVMASLGLMGLAGARRRRRNGGGIAVLALLLVGSSVQGCCDPAVSTDGGVASETSSTSESSSASDGGSTEPTGEPAFPEWAIGIFSSEADKVGMSFMNNPYWWNSIEVTAEGAIVFDLYGCSGLLERQEFRWTLADDGQSLNVQTVPPSDVFTWANGNEVSEVVIERGDSCDAIVIRYHHVDPIMWAVSEQQRGNVCAKATGPDGCTFTFEWCDGVPPPPCE